MSTAILSRPSSPPALSDVNAETYPYDLVQSLLDQTANFSMFAIPVPGHLERATLTPQDTKDWYGLNGGYGLDLLSELHRFESIVRVHDTHELKVSQAIGESTGTFHCLCLFSPPEFQWNLQQPPTPWIFDPWHSQHFTLQKCEVTFGREICCFYGTGLTFPMNVAGRHLLLAGAVANLMSGTGKFAKREGTLVLTGTITPELGFLGNINLRVRDDEGTLITENDLRSIEAMPCPKRCDTFIELRLAKKNKHVETTFGPPPGGRQVSLVTPSEMRSVRYSYIAEPRGPRTQMAIGQELGPMEATVFFDLAAPPGTAQHPVPFTTQEMYQFRNGCGENLGTISCGVVEGQAFGLKFPSAPGQPGVRFAGFGPITGGTGVFKDVQGMLTVNSLIGISPHALSLMHALHLVDLGHKFRDFR
jgi:hypothetical protein